MTVALACGKRGDPLPPLRPYPAAAEGLTIRQVGDHIELSWRAPTRNTDGTTDKLELAQVEVRRRIIDIDALVEAQTKTIEPEAEEDPEDPDTTELGTSETTPPTVEIPDQEPDAVELDVAAGETADPDSPDPLVMDEPEEDELPAAPPTPVLVIPDFAPESRYVTTLDSTEPGETVTFEEAINPMWLGKRLEYAVIYTNRSHRLGPRTTAVQIDPIAALVAPEQPSAEAGDGVVTLRWNQPQPESFFLVYRRREHTPDYPDTPLNPVPISETELEDVSVTFGTGWCYTVRTVPEPPPPPEPALPDSDSDPLAPDVLPDSLAVPDVALDVAPDQGSPSDLETQAFVPTIVVPEIPPLNNTAAIQSQPSPEICLTPTDTFPPPPPTGLVAVRSGVDVLLTWTEIDRADVVGYRVYRARDEQGPFEPLTEDMVRVPSYTDDSVESGEYFYTVTAIDDAPGANESARSEPSAVTFTP